ncbi:MAG: alanine dehydrogenase [Nitrospirae bacterium]|nr:alanine dehydrogenase [Nitrospirota bacterium]
MVIGIPKEIKDNEYRVALIPSGADILVKAGHKVVIQKSAGIGSGFTDEEYKSIGAEIVENAKEVYDKAELIVKVKEPLSAEYSLIKENHIIFTFLHLSADKKLINALIKTKAVFIAYETVELEDGSLPLLTPMSEVAGRLSVLIGAQYLMKPAGSKGRLLGGVPGVKRGKITIIGAGTVGLNAAKIALGIGAEVTIINRGIDKLRIIDNIFGGRVETLASNPYNIEKSVIESDLVIGAVLIKGTKAPVLVAKEMVKKMKKGSVIVDVSIDQGGCVETIKPTTHSHPIYEVDGVIHYGVTNIPGTVPRTSTFALTNTTFPYIKKIADNGLKILKEDSALAKGVNISKGKITYPAVAEALKN